jgi:hypothetical protein
VAKGPGVAQGRSPHNLTKRYADTVTEGSCLGFFSQDSCLFETVSHVDSKQD